MSTKQHFFALFRWCQTGQTISTSQTEQSLSLLISSDATVSSLGVKALICSVNWFLVIVNEYM